MSDKKHTMTESKPAKRIYTLAAAVGLALGSMAFASAATSPSQPSVDQTKTQEVAPSQATTNDDDASEVETPGDFEVDGIDHEFEGEEIGNNGDGVAEADETELDDSSEDDEVGAPDDEDADGVDHEFEGEEIGNNGDGIPDADDAGENVNNG
jgi:hypothetical protein